MGTMIRHLQSSLLPLSRPTLQKLHSTLPSNKLVKLIQAVVSTHSSSPFYLLHLFLIKRDIVKSYEMNQFQANKTKEYITHPDNTTSVKTSYNTLFPNSGTFQVSNKIKKRGRESDEENLPEKKNGVRHTLNSGSCLSSLSGRHQHTTLLEETSQYPTPNIHIIFLIFFLILHRCQTIQ